MLYRLHSNKQDFQRVNRVSLGSIGWMEADLEKLVSTHIQDFLHGEDLMTIFTERKWQEEPDIMALDRAGEIRAAVRALPEKYSAPVHLYYYEGYSIKEIARLLGLPAPTVGTRLARGRERLRQLLKEDVT